MEAMKVFIALSLCVVFVFEVILEQVYLYLLFLSSAFQFIFKKMKADECTSALQKVDYIFPSARFL